MLNHANVPLFRFPAEYEPKDNPTTDQAESMILAMACSRYRLPKVLEIGTWYGVNAANMARIVKPLGGWVTTVDSATPTCPVEKLGSEIPEELKPLIRQLRIDTASFDPLRHIATEEWDIIFIDGDHAYEGVKYDYNSLKRSMSPSGILFLHDVWWDKNPPPTDGPLRLVKEEGSWCVLNMTHLACREEDVCKLYGRIKDATV